jgi:hypothetical protein
MTLADTLTRWLLTRLRLALLRHRLRVIERRVCQSGRRI